MECSPDVPEKDKSQVRAPDQPAASKCSDQNDSIHDLELRSGQIQFVEEPVDVDKGS